tara:strand:+ start:1228 stop:1332 length:105 start_codon:yes stop_codon:yes gene_type:complete
MIIGEKIKNAIIPTRPQELNNPVKKININKRYIM